MPGDSERDELSRLYEEIRHGEDPGQMIDLLQAAQRAGIALTVDEMRLFEEIMRSGGYPVCPEWLVRFISILVRELPHRDILDPSAGIGSLIAPLSWRLHPRRVVGLCRTAWEYALAHLLHPDVQVEWRKGGPEELSGSEEQRFDLITCSLPSDPDTVLFRVEDSTLQAHPSYRLLRAAGELLQDWGIGVFLLPERRINRDSVFSHPEVLGLYVDTVLTLPRGLLVIMRRMPPDTLFIGELSPDQGVQDIIAKNIFLRREGKGPQLGVLAEPDAIFSHREILAERDIRKQMEDSGAEPVEFSTIVLEMNPWKKEGFLERENTIFISPDRSDPVVVSAHAIPDHQDRYIQLVLDPDRAGAAYVAGFLGTPVGKRIRDLLDIRFEQEPFRDALKKTVIYLPPREVQSKVIRVQTSLSQITDSVHSMEQELWNHPKGVEAVARKIDVQLKEEDIESWMEHLPFPLASILWGYRAARDSDHRIDRLFHFFEATSEFIVVIMLSALGPLCKERGVDLLEDDPYFRDSYRFATFRAWNVLGRRLARHTRKLLSNTETRDECLRRYGNPDQDFLDTITSKSLFAILDEVADLRNIWKAHGGVVSEQEEETRLDELERLLAEIRRTLGGSFTGMLLIRPGSGTFHEGLFTYRSEALRGTRIPFLQVVVHSRVPMDTSRLYLLAEGRFMPLELLPLVKLEDRSESAVPAWYFFNRIEGDMIRFVSYHFESDAETLSPAPEIIELLTDFRLIEPRE